MKSSIMESGSRVLRAAAVLAVLAVSCSSGNGGTIDVAGDPSPDEIQEAEEAAPPDVVDAADADAPEDTAPDVPLPTCSEKSFIWVANSAEGTLSKLCTLNGVEMSRFQTSPQTSQGDPSRTSVNLHGDMVVTNRDPDYGPSSVTKFAADPVDCIDRSGDGVIQTSHGGDDVLPWGEDECMIWNTPLPDAAAAAGIGARATAWDGSEDPETGLGGTVWIGAIFTQQVYQLNGDTGQLLQTADLTLGPYGGAMDGRGNYWLVAMGCTVGLCRIGRLNMSTLVADYFQVPCGYGISVDSHGRIWTGGMGCVNRFDPATSESVTLRTTGQFNRGIAVDNQGYVWAAVTTGDVLQVSEEDVTLVTQFHVGPSEVVGVAVDYFGFIWAISQGGNAAIRIDPETLLPESFPVGIGPYTYSDMTGYQLGIVII